MTIGKFYSPPYQIECFIARHKDTGQEYEYSEYGEAKSFCDLYNYDGDHTPENYEPWEIYAKIKNT